MLYDVSSVVNLVKLTKLDLSFTDVYDLRMLEQLPLLRELHLVETLVTVDGLRGVEKIDTLELLDLSQTSVMSLQFLVDGARSLRTLRVKSNRNESGIILGELYRLPCLTLLDLSDTVVLNLHRIEAEEGSWQLFHPSSTLQQLIWRWGERQEASGAVPALPCCVSANRLTGLCELKQLRLLDVSRTIIDSLHFLHPCRMNALRCLYLSSCQALTNDALSIFAHDTPNMTTTNDNSNNSISGSNGGVEAHESVWGTLEELDLTNVTAVNDVSVLRHVPQLRRLWLERTSVTVEGLSALSAQLPSMRVLDISATPAEETVCEHILQHMDSEACVSADAADGSSSNNNNSKEKPEYDEAVMEALYQFIFLAHQSVRQRRESVYDGYDEVSSMTAAQSTATKEAQHNSDTNSDGDGSTGVSWKRIYDSGSSGSRSPKQSSLVQRKRSASLPSLTPVQFRVQQSRGVSFVSDQEVRAHLTGLSKEPTCKGS